MKCHYKQYIVISELAVTSVWDCCESVMHVRVPGNLKNVWNSLRSRGRYSRSKRPFRWPNIRGRKCPDTYITTHSRDIEGRVMVLDGMPPGHVTIKVFGSLRRRERVTYASCYSQHLSLKASWEWGERVFRLGNEKWTKTNSAGVSSFYLVLTSQLTNVPK